MGFNKNQPSQRQGAPQTGKVLGRIHAYLPWKKATQTTCFPQDLRQTCCLTPLIPKAAEFPGNSMARTNHHFLFRKWKWCTIVLFSFFFFFIFGGKNNFWIPSPLSEGSYNGAQPTVTFHNVGEEVWWSWSSFLICNEPSAKLYLCFRGPQRHSYLKKQIIKSFISSRSCGSGSVQPTHKYIYRYKIYFNTHFYIYLFVHF